MLDEPFAGVDPIAVEDIQQIVWKLKDRNIGILITDHNVQETLSITDRAYLLFEGKILFQGTPEELAENKIVREKYLSNSFCASPQGLYGVEPVFAAAYNNKPITIKRRCVKMHTFIILRTKPRLSQAGALLLPKDSVSLGIRISL